MACLFSIQKRMSMINIIESQLLTSSTEKISISAVKPALMKSDTSADVTVVVKQTGFLSNMHVRPNFCFFFILSNVCDEMNRLQDSFKKKEKFYLIAKNYVVFVEYKMLYKEEKT